MQLVISRRTIFGLLSLAIGKAFLRSRSSHELVRAARSRDRRAFDELVAANQGSLKRFVTRRVNANDREDVLQDTWLAAWESLPSFDGSCDFRTWIHSICYHKIQDHWRREHARPQTASLPDSETRAAYLPKEFERVDLNEALREFWETCTPDQRELLQMYYSDGLTLKEISTVMNRNLSTVKYQFYRVHEIAGPILMGESQLLLAEGAAL